MKEIREVTIADILKARDERAERQRQMLLRHHCPLVSFTMNIAGPIKNDQWIERAFREGVKRIEAVLSGRRAQILETFSVAAFTGCEQIWAVDSAPGSLKEWMRMLEEQDALGRLFDIDVIAVDGAKLSRESERKCLVCGGPVRACARSRAHSADEIFRRTHEIIEDYFRSRFVRSTGEIAEKALLYEVATTPKPGLVDFENSGAHSDMDRFTFIDSACALRSYFVSCIQTGIERRAESPAVLFELLRSLGQQAEADMLAATGNVNTHKGALFSLGILCCAAGMQFDRDSSTDELLSTAAKLAAASLSDFEKLSAESNLTGGEQQFLSGGLTGVRGEAAAGFPSVRNIALPALERALSEGKNRNDAGLAALLALMASVSDSNVLRRAGESVLEQMRREASSVFRIDHEALREMNERFVSANISPGGCADLLAAAWFIHEFCK